MSTRDGTKKRRGCVIKKRQFQLHATMSIELRQKIKVNDTVRKHARRNGQVFEMSELFLLEQNLSLFKIIFAVTFLMLEMHFRQ